MIWTCNLNIAPEQARLLILASIDSSDERYKTWFQRYDRHPQGERPFFGAAVCQEFGVYGAGRGYGQVASVAEKKCCVAIGRIGTSGVVRSPRPLKLTYTDDGDSGRIESSQARGQARDYRRPRKDPLHGLGSTFKRPRKGYSVASMHWSCQCTPYFCPTKRHLELRCWPRCTKSHTKNT